ncbi:armadillo-like helical domain-containing protein 3 [Phymastichus coffea]|uniref:armadillo-like helical domain-containing protein 3 n=1 Tax=Phymastichus coffea TaxID=108790 RepID=UPI00273CF0B3|nr:armadillo-like helical domain-containing protein 3 [Phymastichus coffea]
MITVNRSDGVKRKYRGKFLIMCDNIFSGEDVTLTYPNFWNELLLIKPYYSYVESEIMKLDQESLTRCKKNLNTLMLHCVEALNDENGYKIIHSVQTISVVLFSLFKKLSEYNINHDLLDVLFGVDSVEEKMTNLIKHSNAFITGEYPSSLKASFIQMYLIIATGMGNMDENLLIKYMMNSTVFESLIELLKDKTSRNHHGHSIILILMLLVNYKKHKSTNPFIVKLSILDDELALNGYGQVISSTLSDFCRKFPLLNVCVEGSWFSSLTNIIGNIFVGEEETKWQHIQDNNSALLALYEAIHLNRNFMTTLAYTQNEETFPVYQKDTANQNASEFQTLEVTTQPSNLLAIFFQYCSIIMHATPTDRVNNNVKLCFLILNCISEDQYANSLMHDANLVFKVPLYKISINHRKYGTSMSFSQPLAATLIDIMIDFISSHMVKKFNLELYSQCLGILLRILYYQKRSCIRLNYEWIKLWTVLINLIKFLTLHENHLAKKMNIFSLATEVVKILNIFITYGDTFLFSSSAYDKLFYEIIRMKMIFINLHAMGLRYSNCEHYKYKESAAKLTNALVNIRDILDHFSPKINEWLVRQNISTPSENQIMAIIIEHYDSLTLKLQENLDHFERYSEHDTYSEFFSNLVSNMITATRLSINIEEVDCQSIFKDCSPNNQ